MKRAIEDKIKSCIVKRMKALSKPLKKLDFVMRMSEMPLNRIETVAKIRPKKGNMNFFKAESDFISICFVFFEYAFINVTLLL